MFFSNCGGCIQVPVPVQYWSPYISPRKTPTFHIADILHQQMTTAMPQVCQNVNVSRKNVQDSTDFKYKSVSMHSKRTEFVQRLKETDRTTHTSKQDKLSRISENIMKLKQCGDSVQCSLPSALAPLQALCSSDVKCYNDRSKDSHKRSSENTNSSNHLKFGINRILSEDFGKETTEKESSEALTGSASGLKRLRRWAMSNITFHQIVRAADRTQYPWIQENDPDDTQEFEDVQCDCSEYRQLSYSNYALSAVHAIQPPRYPSSSSGTDTLPGPYSILNTDVNNGGQGKRKRSWSRAVFSNLQRKGLEKRFEVQKYVTKPDRRQLAAMLGLTDAQVKVWFQNRRMKWRHTQQQQTDEDKVDKNQSSGSEVTEADMDDSVESHDHDDVNSEQDSPDKD